MVFTPDVPDEVLYGRVGGNFVRFLADSPSDSGTLPDQKPINGFVTLVPGVKTARWLTTSPTRLSVIENVECPIIDGVLYPPETLTTPDGVVVPGSEPDVWLVASHQPAAQPSYIPWTATFRLVGVANQPAPIQFNVIPGERVDLVSVAPARPEPPTVVVTSHEDLLAVQALRAEILNIVNAAPKWWTGTQAEYNALPVKRADTLYLVV